MTQPGTNPEGNGEGASSLVVGERAFQGTGVLEEEKSQKPKISILKASNTSKSPQNPFSQLGVRAGGEETPKHVAPAPINSRPVTTLKRDRPSSAGGDFSSKSGESLGAWENKALSAIFRLTLDPNINRDGPGNHLHFVGSVRSELEDRNEAMTLSTAVLDQAILEAASKLEKISPLDYLLGCWKRVSRQHRALKGASAEDPKSGIIKEARRLCMSYCIFAVTMPEMFG